MKVYLDNSATTKLDSRVFASMKPYLLDKYSNPSSIHLEGQALYLDLERARNEAAKILGVEARGIIFTASATEANNLIIKGFARANRTKEKSRILVSELEHPSVLEAARELEDEGFKLDYLRANKRGIIESSELEKKIDDKVLLVSVMAVNNEIGTINNIEALAKITHKFGAYFHSDIVQAIPYLKIDGEKMGLDFFSLSAHKFNGPRGVGLAYIKPGLKIKSQIVGGGQEDNKRAGTHNLAGIIGLVEALKISYQERSSYLKNVRVLRDYLWRSLNKEIKGLKVNGCLKARVAANLNIMFGSIEGEAILMDLAYKGISVSTGSACSASNLKSSYVLRAIGLEDYSLNSNIRFSLGRFNTKAEIDYTIKALKETVTRLRSFSPVESSVKTKIKNKK